MSPNAKAEQQRIIGEFQSAPCYAEDFELRGGDSREYVATEQALYEVLESRGLLEGSGFA